MQGRQYFRGPEPKGAGGRFSAQDWDKSCDLARQHYFSHENCYTSGPGVYLAGGQNPHNIGPERMPYKLFISGLHPHFTEDGIYHIVSQYGNPISVRKFRNRRNEPVAFVDFETQREADNVIIVLDRKPPLNWSVTYANTRPARHEDPLAELLDIVLREDLDRQTPLHAVPTVGAAAGGVSAAPCITACRPPFPPPNVVHTGVPIAPRCTNDSDFPHCVVCGEQAPMVCTVCRTRYCSTDCQSSDWPDHKNKCSPPPALAPAESYPIGIVRRVPLSTATVTELANSSVGATPRESPNLVATQNTGCGMRNPSPALVNPQPPLVKGIHPLDQNGAPNVSGNASRPNSNGPSNSTMNGARPQSRDSRQQSPIQRATSKNDFGPNANGSPQKSNYANDTFSGRSSVVMKNVSPRAAPAQQPAFAAKNYARAFSDNKLATPPSSASVVVCYAKSPTELYVQYQRYSEALTKLMKAVEISATESIALPANPAELTPCVAIFPDDRNWYRARVMKVCPDGIVVGYVDFGNKMKLPNTRENLRQMEMALSQDPFYAVQVKLDDVQPTTDGDLWPPQIRERFKDLMESNPFTMKLVRVEENGVFVVRLKSLDNGVDVSELLIEKRWAKPLFPKSEIVDKLDLVAATPAGAEASSPSSSATRPQKSVLRNLQAVSPKIEAALKAPPCKPVVSDRSDTTPSNGPALSGPSKDVSEPLQLAAVKKEPITTVIAPSAPVPSPTPRIPVPNARLLLSRKTTPTSPKQSTLVAQPKPASTTKARSIVSQLKVGDVGIFSFGAHLDESSQLAGSFVRNADQDAIPLEFHSFFNGVSESLPGFDPPVRTLVAAFSPEHQHWFRGCVLRASSSAYTILYIDYGNVEENVTLVKAIPSDYDYLELAVKLTILGDGLTSKAMSDAAKLLEENYTSGLKVISVADDGSVFADWETEGVPPYRVKLEPWRTILPPLLPNPQPEIKARSWQVGFTGDVLICVADDLDHIYGQVVNHDTIEQEDQIGLALHEYWLTSAALPAAPAVGSYVAAIYPEDGGFYRARVMDVKGNLITLHYIDYGNSSTVPLSDVRSLPDDLYKHPRLCNRFTLGGLSTRPSGSLPTAVKNLLASHVNERCSMSVLKSSDELVECTLSKDGRIINQLVSELLKSPVAADAVPVATKQVQQPESTAHSMPKLEVASPEVVKEKAQESVPQKLNEESQTVAVDNTFGTFLYGDAEVHPIPESGSFQVRIMCADSPHYVMVCSPDPTLIDQLARLDEEVAVYADGVSMGHTPGEGEICLVQSEGAWYRAACLDLNDPHLVLLVDYGKMMHARSADIRRIPKRFVAGLPFLASHSILKGFENEEEPASNVSARVSQLLPFGEVVDVTFIRRDGDAIVLDIPAVSAVLKSEGLI